MPTITKMNKARPTERCQSFERGFTLIEFLISIAIVSVILAIVVSNQPKYLDGIALTNLADEVSSMVFQAQAWSAGVKEFSPGLGEFSASYGLTFNLLGSGSNTAYLFFADRSVYPNIVGNKIYDGDWSCPIGGASECLGKFDISRGNYIESLCVLYYTSPIYYVDNCDVGRVDISFAYSSGETQLLFYKTSGNLFNLKELTQTEGAKIVLKSPGGLSWSVVVHTNGQVSVLKTESQTQ